MDVSMFLFTCTNEMSKRRHMGLGQIMYNFGVKLAYEQKKKHVRKTYRMKTVHGRRASHEDVDVSHRLSTREVESLRRGSIRFCTISEQISPTSKNGKTQHTKTVLGQRARQMKVSLCLFSFAQHETSEAREIDAAKRLDQIMYDFRVHLAHEDKINIV